MWRLLPFVLVLGACRPAELPPASEGCRDADLAAILTACEKQIGLDCKRGPDGKFESSCPTLVECERQVDAWEACGAGTGRTP